MPQDAQRNLVTHVVARELLRRVATSLARASIPVMPLKGVWLQATVYDPPESRPITDVDVLVPESAFEQARTRLERDGFTPEQGNVSELALRHPELPMQLDLHRRLFQPGAFAMPTAQLFARARLDREIFGVEVWQPDPLDALAHLVGHFVKSRAAPAGSAYHDDFARIADRYVEDPVACANHLRACGMARAARYAFAHNVRHGHARVAAVVAALPPDPLARPLCLLSQGVAPLRSPLGALPGALLDRSVPAGLLGAGRRMLARVRRS